MKQVCAQKASARTHQLPGFPLQSVAARWLIQRVRGLESLSGVQSASVQQYSGGIPAF
jgi:hypothetical protein